MAMPSPDTPAQIPIARARSRSSWNVFVRIDSVVGKMQAPPMPISARARMSMSADELNDAIAEKTPNSARPMVRMPLRP